MSKTKRMPRLMNVNLSDNAIRVLEKRYLKKDTNGQPTEKPIDMFKRVANNIASADKIFDKDADITKTEEMFLNMMLSNKFLPNSPTLMNAGRDLQQLSACFVLPVGDSMEEIFDSVKNAALIHKSGGGTGFAFSRLRPKNDAVKSTSGVSSGPVSFMKVFNSATEVIKQGGTRRGANMGILRVDHPDIMEFIHCKSDSTELNNFNISVAITKEFMEAFKGNTTYKLYNPHDRSLKEKNVLEVGELDANMVFDTIVKLAWKNGEPGIVFIDRINKYNPTPALGDMESTNPCGEQPLLPYEACNLGSINLKEFIEGDKFDYDALKETVHNSIHFLDNVIEVNNYPIPEIDRLARGNRKIGLGIMGFADALFLLEMAYDSEEAEKFAHEVMSFIQKESHDASCKLALRRGNFVYHDKSIFKDPMRNATTTTIAPTGTISIIADCSSGIEPIFALAFKRNVMDNQTLVEVNRTFLDISKREGFYTDDLMELVATSGSVKNIESIPEKWRNIFKVSHDISPEWHIRIQAAFQKYVDNAVSKTINFPHSATEKNVRDGYLLAYELGCKGSTVYRDGSRDNQVLTIGTANQDVTSAECSVTPRIRPKITFGYTIKINTACGKLYVTINEDDHGLCEVFATIGKSGGCASSQAEGISRLVSLALRSGLDVYPIIKQLRGIRCTSPIWEDGELILSCPDAIGRALEMAMDIRENREKGNFNVSDIENMVKEKRSSISYNASSGGEICPECSSSLDMSEGCMTCRSCGYSKCS